MSLHYACDGGCGAMTDAVDVWPEYGYVVKRRYCEKCGPAMEQLLADRDLVHEEVASLFQKRTLKLVAVWKKKHPQGRLPDESPALPADG